MKSLSKTLAPIFFIIGLISSSQVQAEGTHAKPVVPKPLSSLSTNISHDENVIFFRTDAWFNAETEQWHLPIHAWVYEPQNSKVRTNLFAKSLEKSYRLEVTEKNKANFLRRTNLMIADNERGKQLVINLAGKLYPLKKSQANGHIQDEILISKQEIESLLTKRRTSADSEIDVNEGMSSLSSRTIGFTSQARGKEGEPPRLFKGEVMLINPEGISIISDIDDTIKITDVTDRKALMRNTFLEDFKAVPAMAEAYREWNNQQVNIHFVSSSPWHLYEPLIEFMTKANFPWATLNLKSIRLKDSSILNLFKKGTETKPAQIEPILLRYPSRQFILIGDSGEQDPEVYADIYNRYQAQILHIYIRNINQEAVNNVRFKEVFSNIPKSQWSLFSDAYTELVAKLSE